MLTLLRRFVVAVGITLTVVTSGYLVTRARELHVKQQVLAEYDQLSGLPLPPPGHLTVRTKSGDRPEHWEIEIRCHETYTPYFHHAFGRFHPTELKAVNPIYNMNFTQTKTGRAELAAASIPAGGTLKIELRLQEDARGDLLLGYRGLDVRYPVLRIPNITGKPLAELSAHFFAMNQPETHAASEPLRLFAVGPNAEFQSDDPVDGVMCCIFSAEPSRVERNEVLWDLKREQK